MRGDAWHKLVGLSLFIGTGGCRAAAPSLITAGRCGMHCIKRSAHAAIAVMEPTPSGLCERRSRRGAGARDPLGMPTVTLSASPSQPLAFASPPYHTHSFSASTFPDGGPALRVLQRGRCGAFYVVASPHACPRPLAPDAPQHVSAVVLRRP
eukprot:ctg_4055.g417